MRPCAAEHPEPKYRQSEPFDPAIDCRRCWLYHNDPAYNRLWKGEGVSHPPPLPPLWKQALNITHAAARHAANGFRETPLELRVLREAACRGCEFLSDKRCSKCGCFLATKVAWESESCPVGKWPTPIEYRHLLMHVYPKKGNGVWQMNLDQVLSRIDLFNGVRCIAIAVDETTDSADAVKEYAAGQNIDWLVDDNDASLREVASHSALWEKVATKDPGHATFFCHGKGVGHPFNPGVSVHPWARVMYEAALDYWPIVESKLWRHPCVGSFKKNVHGFGGSSSSWHYSGSYYWIRNDALFAKNWRHIDRVWYGVEPWPSLHFTSEEAGVLFHEGGQFNLYDHAGYFAPTILQEFDKWKADNQASRSAGR